MTLDIDIKAPSQVPARPPASLPAPLPLRLLASPLELHPEIPMPAPLFHHRPFREPGTRNAHRQQGEL